MRALLFLVAVVLALPQVLITVAFLILGHVTAERTLGSLLTRMLDTIYILFSWGGLLALIGFIALLAAGFVSRSQPYAAGIVAAAVVASSALLVVKIGLDDPVVFAPGLLALAICAYLIWFFLRAA